MAYQLFYLVLFGGAVVWGGVRFAQTRRRSHLLLILLGLLPLVSLLRPSPLILPGVILLAALRWYVQWRERELPMNDGELAERARLTRKVTEKRRSALPGPKAAPTSESLPEDNGALRDATAQSGWVELEVATPAATLRCEGGRLEIAAGPIRARARFDHESRPEVDLVRMVLVLADSSGQDWEVKSWFSADPFTDYYEEDELRDPLESQNGFTPWSEAPEAFRRSLEERCLLAAVRGLQDSRRSVELRLGRESYSVRMKYQAPCVDVALFGAELLVRVSGLFYDSYGYGPPGAERELDDIHALPAFAFLVPARVLLCYAEPRRHWAAAAHMDEYETAEAPACRASRLESQGTAQASVVFHAGEP